MENNWAVIVSSSDFWFNYRHVANALSVYQIVRRLGIPDERILLLLSDDVACNERNAIPGTVFNHGDRHHDVYGGCGWNLQGFDKFSDGKTAGSADQQHQLWGGGVRVALRGAQVTAANVIRLLTDRWPEGTLAENRLLSDANSRLFVYMSGHGGDNFLKLRDMEEISSQELGDAFNQMHAMKRYKEVLFMVDTCQASTLFDQVDAPNMIMIASSLKDESSYSHHVDDTLGVSVLDRFTWTVVEATEHLENRENLMTVQDLYNRMDFRFLSSHPFIKHTSLGSSGTDTPADRTLFSFMGSAMEVRSFDLSHTASMIGGDSDEEVDADDQEASSRDLLNQLVYSQPIGVYHLEDESWTAPRSFEISLKPSSRDLSNPGSFTLADAMAMVICSFILLSIVFMSRRS